MASRNTDPFPELKGVMFVSPLERKKAEERVLAERAVKAKAEEEQRKKEQAEAEEKARKAKELLEAQNRRASKLLEKVKGVADQSADEFEKQAQERKRKEDEEFAARKREEERKKEEERLLKERKEAEERARKEEEDKEKQRKLLEKENKLKSKTNLAAEEEEAEKRWLSTAVTLGKIKLEKRKGSLIAIPIGSSEQEFKVEGASLWSADVAYDIIEEVDGTKATAPQPEIKKKNSGFQVTSGDQSSLYKDDTSWVKSVPSGQPVVRRTSEVGRLDQRQPYDEAPEDAAPQEPQEPYTTGTNTASTSASSSPTKRSGIAIAPPGATSGPSTRDDKAWIKAGPQPEYAPERPEPLVAKVKDSSSWIAAQAQEQEAQREQPKSVGKLEKRASVFEEGQQQTQPAEPTPAAAVSRPLKGDWIKPKEEEPEQPQKQQQQQQQQQEEEYGVRVKSNSAAAAAAGAVDSQPSYINSPANKDNVYGKKEEQDNVYGKKDENVYGKNTPQPKKEGAYGKTPAQQKGESPYGKTPGQQKPQENPYGKTPGQLRAAAAAKDEEEGKDHVYGEPAGKVKDSPYGKAKVAESPYGKLNSATPETTAPTAVAPAQPNNYEYAEKPNSSQSEYEKPTKGQKPAEAAAPAAATAAAAAAAAPAAAAPAPAAGGEGGEKKKGLFFVLPKSMGKFQFQTQGRQILGIRHFLKVDKPKKKKDPMEKTKIAMVTCTDVIFLCEPKGDTGAYELLEFPAQRDKVTCDVAGPDYTDNCFKIKFPKGSYILEAGSKEESAYWPKVIANRVGFKPTSDLLK